MDELHTLLAFYDFPAVHAVHLLVACRRADDQTNGPSVRLSVRQGRLTRAITLTRGRQSNSSSHRVTDADRLPHTLTRRAYGHSC